MLVLVSLILVASAQDKTCWQRSNTRKHNKDDLIIQNRVFYTGTWNLGTRSYEYQYMDMVKPPNGDNRRPVVAMAHGGGFHSQGQESNTMKKLEVAFGKRMGQYGFVAVSLDWPGIGEWTKRDSSGDTSRAFVTDDTKMNMPAESCYRCVLKLQDDKDTYNINHLQIMIGGDSSGAFVALWAGYTPEGKRNAPLISGTLKLVISVSGAMWRQKARSATNQPALGYKPGQVWGPDHYQFTPLAMVHGGMDPVVPWYKSLAICRKARKTPGLGKEKVRCIWMRFAGHIPYFPHHGMLCPRGNLLKGRDWRKRNFMTRLNTFYEARLGLSENQCAQNNGDRRLEEADDVFV